MKNLSCRAECDTFIEGVAYRAFWDRLSGYILNLLTGKGYRWYGRESGVQIDMSERGCVNTFLQTGTGV